MASSEPDTSIYELRCYDVAAGRLADEVARMYDVAIAGERGGPASMFDRYGIPRPLGAWTGMSGTREPQFGYILRWDSLAQRDAAFPAFWADPDWLELRARTDGGVPLVERMEDWLLRPSPSWNAARQFGDGLRQDAGWLTEMLVQKPENGFVADATAAHAGLLLPLLARHGAVLLGVFDVVIGPDMPCMVTFLAWPDQPTQDAAWRAVDVDPGMRAAAREQGRTHGHALIRSSEHSLLRPVHFGRPKPHFARPQA